MTDETTIPEDAAFGFKKCHICAAAFVNSEEDIKKHLAHHAGEEADQKHLGLRINAIIRRLNEVLQVAHASKDTANQARRDAAALLAKLEAVRQEHPTNEALAVAELTDDEIDAYTPPDEDDDLDDEPDQQYLNDTTPPATIDADDDYDDAVDTVSRATHPTAAGYFTNGTTA